MKSFIISLPSRFIHAARSAWTYAFGHKVIAGIAILLVLGGGYWAYASAKADAVTTQYALARVTSEPIQSTVTASGQVAASHQLDLSPKATGEVTSVTVKAGDAVKAGQVIATIDSTDAQKTVRDAQLSLESAQISYTQAITSANTSITNGETSVTNANDSGFDAVTSAEQNLATVTDGLTTLLLGPNELTGYGGPATLIVYANLMDNNEPTAQAVRQTTRDSYDAAIASYNETFAAYQAASRDGSPQDTQDLLAKVRDTTTKVNAAVKDTQVFLQLTNTTVQNHDLLPTPPSLASQISTINSYMSTMNSTASSLSSAQSSLTSAVQSNTSNTQSITGGTPLAIQSAELTLARAKQSLADAEASLADYVVRAPFDGTIAEVNVQKFDQSTSKVATLITNEQYADISLNETDIAKVRAGQTATLTFDAIDGLTIDGTVAQVNQIGTVSQNVTTYTVKIGFDTQDARVKPGMTVNAAIVTASKDAALVVPSSAVKTSGTEHYVEVATMTTAAAPSSTGATASSTAMRRMRTSSSTPSTAAGSASSTRATTGAVAGRTLTVDTSSVTVTRVPVTIGIESDTMTEITSGLSAGQLVVSQSLNASGKTAAQSGSIFSFLTGSRTTGTGATRTGATGAGGTTGAFRTTGAAGGGAARPAGAAGGF
jgi:HlyD family secretion protein